MNSSGAKLTSKDIWELIKYSSIAVIVCAIVFVIPFFVLSGAEVAFKTFSGSEFPSRWLGYLLGVVLFYFLVFNLTFILSSLSRLCADLSKMTVDLSFFKKTLLVILILVYLAGLNNFPKITFFVSVLILIPGSFTYERYKIIKKGKDLSS